MVVEENSQQQHVAEVHNCTLSQEGGSVLAAAGQRSRSMHKQGTCSCVSASVFVFVSIVCAWGWNFIRLLCTWMADVFRRECLAARLACNLLLQILDLCLLLLHLKKQQAPTGGQWRWEEDSGVVGLMALVGRETNLGRHPAEAILLFIRRGLELQILLFQPSDIVLADLPRPGLGHGELNPPPAKPTFSNAQIFRGHAVISERDVGSRKL
jgi:hypothetical protein